MGFEGRGGAFYGVSAIFVIERLIRDGGRNLGIHRIRSPALAASRCYEPRGDRAGFFIRFSSNRSEKNKLRSSSFDESKEFVSCLMPMRYVRIELDRIVSLSTLSSLTSFSIRSQRSSIPRVVEMASVELRTSNFQRLPTMKPCSVCRSEPSLELKRADWPAWCCMIACWKVVERR